MKRFIWIAAGLIVFGCLSFFWLVPHAVDRFQNGVHHKENLGALGPALHQEIRVVDLHADTLLWDRDLLKRGTRGHVDLVRLQEGNVTLQVFSVVTKSPRGLNIEMNRADSDNITTLAVAQRWPRQSWGSLLQRALYQAQRLQQAESESRGKIRMIRTRKDLERLLSDRHDDPQLVGALLALEGSHALEGSLESLELLQAQGFRMLAPTHLFDSDISGSQQGESKAGLSELGRKWVKEMNRRHLMIDLAHASGKTIDEVLALSEKPILVSHTGLQAICPSNRNLTDDQIRAIAKSGGLIGIGFWDEALCAKDYGAVAKSLRHLIDVGGLSVAALGSDWDGFVSTVTDASGLNQLTQKLLEEKFTDEEIRSVMGENAIRFFLSQLP